MCGDVPRPVIPHVPPITTRYRACSTYYHWVEGWLPLGTGLVITGDRAGYHWVEGWLPLGRGLVTTGDRAGCVTVACTPCYAKPTSH